MSKVLDIRDGISVVHKANLQASLARRLEVAKARNDRHLVELLEDEQQQLRLARADQGTDHNTQQSWITWLKNAWQGIVNDVTHSSEVQVWQRLDQSGTHWWHAYDPLTGRSVYTSSESEMRLWIEENYNGR